MNLDRPWPRLAGLLMIFAGLALYDPESTSAEHGRRQGDDGNVLHERPGPGGHEARQEQPINIA